MLQITPGECENTRGRGGSVGAADRVTEKLLLHEVKKKDKK